MSAGFLILEVNGTVYSTRARLGDGVVKDRVHRTAARFGYELKPDGIRRSFAERAMWPLTLRAYTSMNPLGRGRAGSSLYSYPAKPIPCRVCSGRGEHSGTGMCKVCGGSGRRGTKRRRTA